MKRRDALGPGPGMEWLDLRQLTQYASVSERTLRGWIHDGSDPLPASQVGGKILVRRQVFDEFMERHRIRRPGLIDDAVEEILAGVTKG